MPLLNMPLLLGHYSFSEQPDQLEKEMEGRLSRMRIAAKTGVGIRRKDRSRIRLLAVPSRSVDMAPHF